MKTNANLPATKRTCGLIGSSDRENGGKRQDARRTRSAASCSSDRENGGKRQELDALASVADGSSDRENGGKRQVGFAQYAADGGSSDRKGGDSGPLLRRYTFKLYPNAAQAAALTRQAALLASFWNAALEQRETQWAHECQRKGKGERKGLGYFEQARSIKLVRADEPDFAAMSASSIELCLRALDDAFRAFFRRAKGGAGKSSGYPKYKSPYAIEHKNSDCTVWHRDHRKGWRLDKAGKHFRVYAKGIPGILKARGKFPLHVDDLELRDMRLIRVSGEWFCSIVVKIAARRKAGAQSVHVKFDLIDEFALVKIGANGECLPGWAGEFTSPNEQIRPTSKRLDDVRLPDASERGPTAGASARLSAVWSLPDASERGPTAGTKCGTRYERVLPDASERGPTAGCAIRLNDAAKLPDALEQADAAQSKRDTRRKKFSYRWRQETRRIAKQKAKEARRRREALHRWTTEIVAAASELAVTCPPIKESTASARGNEREHGAAVKTVAALNRHVLAQAPALAIQMLEYKSAEAGIPFAILKDDESPVALGRDLQTATKAVRKLRRELKRKAPKK